MNKIDKYFWIKNNPSVNHAYCYSSVYNYLQIFYKDTDIFSLRNFYKL